MCVGKCVVAGLAVFGLFLLDEQYPNPFGQIGAVISGKPTIVRVEYRRVGVWWNKVPCAVTVNVATRQEYLGALAMYNARHKEQGHSGTYSAVEDDQREYRCKKGERELSFDRPAY